MDEQTKKMKQLRLTIIITSIVGLLYFQFMGIIGPFCGVFFSPLTDESLDTIFLLVPIVSLISTILIIAKVRFGFFLTLFIALIFCVSVSDEVGKCLIFDLSGYDSDYTLIVFCDFILPYFTFLILIPLTAIFLGSNLKIAKTVKLTSILLAIGIFTFSIVDRFNRDYSSIINVEANISEQGLVTFNCRPEFTHPHSFTVTTNLKEIEEQVRKLGEYRQGKYFFGARITKNYRFNKLQSITLTQIANVKISPQHTWTISEIKGDVDFLEP